MVGRSSRPYNIFYVIVAIGEFPREDALKGTPVFPDAKEAGDGGKKEPQDATAVHVAQQTNTLMSLIKAHESFEGSAKSSRIWLGEGLGSIPKRVHDHNCSNGNLWIYLISAPAQQQMQPRLTQILRNWWFFQALKFHNPEKACE